MCLRLFRSEKRPQRKRQTTSRGEKKSLKVSSSIEVLTVNLEDKKFARAGGERRSRAYGQLGISSLSLRRWMDFFCHREPVLPRTEGSIS